LQIKKVPGHGPIIYIKHYIFNNKTSKPTIFHLSSLKSLNTQGTMSGVEENSSLATKIIQR